MTIHDLIFRYLKESGPSTIFEIRNGLGINLLYLDNLLGEMRRNGWIELDIPSEKWYIVTPLFPPMSDEERRGKENQFWNYEKIVEAKERIEGASLMPDQHPFVKYFPTDWMQGGAPICVGAMTALAQMANYLACTGDYPSDNEMSEMAGGLTMPKGGCTFVYHRYYHAVFSMYFAYRISQIIANIPPDTAGSYTSASVQAWQKVGGVPWHECLSPETVFCMPPIPAGEMEVLRVQANNHRIEGYSEIISWSALKSAIINSPAHVVLMPINMYEGGYDGNFNLRMDGRVIGAHALPWCFVDQANDRIGCYNSWGKGYPRITWINEEYWRNCAGKGFAILDSAEVKIARQLYSRVSVTSNVACRFSINGEARDETLSFVVALEKGKDYTIRAYPIKPEEVVESFMERTFTADKDSIDIAFAFTKKIILPKPGSISGRIKEIFDRIMKKLFRR